MSTVYLFVFAFLLLFTTQVFAVSERSYAIQTYLQQGKPKQAISTAHLLLGDPRLDETERKHLLELIIKAEVMIAKARHYEDVSAAVEAIETLITEFPTAVDEAKLIWDMAELLWHQNNFEGAQSHILDLQNRFPDSPQTQDSWLLVGKIYFIHKNYAEARNAFLRYSLAYAPDSTQGYEVRMWTALVDYEERRYDIAYLALKKIFSAKPELITSQDSIYARYTNLLDIQNKKPEALQQANLFLAQYKNSTHSPKIRLLQADLIHALPSPDMEIVIKSYSLLASQEADTIIGRQAFMRKMMIQMRNKTTYTSLKPAIIALKRIANRNQMSEIEDEAFLHEARLWSKAARLDPKNSPAEAIKASLEQFSHAQQSTNPRIAVQAKREGRKSFTKQVQLLIKQKNWLAVASLWEHFPGFRPPLQASTQLRFAVAHGLRLLMEYDASETILTELRKQSDGSVWGEKVMLEQARLWLDRRDKDGVHKIMQWLDRHEYTLYRPEMLVIVARMHLQNKNALAASHALEQITPEDIAPDAKAEFWKTTALTEEVLSHWHLAARAWRLYAQQDVDDIEQAHLNEANALFKGDNFIKAEQLYSKTAKGLQSPAWGYRYSICQLKSGKWNQAIARLTTLKNNPNGGIYASMAALTLVEREADRLLEKRP